jgi:hypothetical protein
VDVLEAWMSALCVVCSTEKKPMEAEGSTLVCFNDSNRILRRLRELEEYLPTLHLLKPATGIQEYSTVVFGPRSPANDAVLVHTDPRSGTEVTELQDGTVVAEYSALGVAVSWAAVVVEERGVTPAKTPMMSLVLLRQNHDWITKQPWVDEYAAELKEVHRSVRALAFDPIPTPVGKCIRFKRDRECKGDVFELDDASGVRCSKCGDIYTGLDLERFRVAQEAG